MGNIKRKKHKHKRTANPQNTNEVLDQGSELNEKLITDIEKKIAALEADNKITRELIAARKKAYINYQRNLIQMQIVKARWMLGLYAHLEQTDYVKFHTSSIQKILIEARRNLKHAATPLFLDSDENELSKMTDRLYVEDEPLFKAAFLQTMNHFLQFTSEDSEIKTSLEKMQKPILSGQPIDFDAVYVLEFLFKESPNDITIADLNSKEIKPYLDTPILFGLKLGLLQNTSNPVAMEIINFVKTFHKDHAGLTFEDVKNELVTEISSSDLDQGEQYQFNTDLTSLSDDIISFEDEEGKTLKYVLDIKMTDSDYFEIMGHFDKSMERIITELDEVEQGIESTDQMDALINPDEYRRLSVAESQLDQVIAENLYEMKNKKPAMFSFLSRPIINGIDPLLDSFKVEQDELIRNGYLEEHQLKGLPPVLFASEKVRESVDRGLLDLERYGFEPDDEFSAWYWTGLLYAGARREAFLNKRFLFNHVPYTKGSFFFDSKRLRSVKMDIFQDILSSNHHRLLMLTFFASDLEEPDTFKYFIKDDLRKSKFDSVLVSGITEKAARSTAEFVKENVKSNVPVFFTSFTSPNIEELETGKIWTDLEFYEQFLVQEPANYNENNRKSIELYYNDRQKKIIKAGVEYLACEMPYLWTESVPKAHKKFSVNRFYKGFEGQKDELLEELKQFIVATGIMESRARKTMPLLDQMYEQGLLEKFGMSDFEPCYRLSPLTQTALSKPGIAAAANLDPETWKVLHFTFNKAKENHHGNWYQAYNVSNRLNSLISGSVLVGRNYDDGSVGLFRLIYPYKQVSICNFLYPGIDRYTQSGKSYMNEIIINFLKDDMDPFRDSVLIVTAVDLETAKRHSQYVLDNSPIYLNGLYYTSMESDDFFDFRTGEKLDPSQMRQRIVKTTETEFEPIWQIDFDRYSFRTNVDE